MEPLTLEVEPDSRDVEFLNRQINEFNLNQTSVPFDGELSFFEHDANGDICAGVYGWTWGGCCEIRYLWVHAREQLVTRGLPLGALRMLQRHDVIRPKMTPWFNSEGRRIGAVEGWRMAPPLAPRPERLDCAVIDFAE